MPGDCFCFDYSPPHELITAADYCSITGSISQSYLFGVMQAGAAAFSEANVRRQ